MQTLALRHHHGSGHVFGDDAVRLDAEARIANFPDLVSGFLPGGWDSGVGKTRDMSELAKKRWSETVRLGTVVLCSGWLIHFEPELLLGEDIVVPDIAGWRRETMSEDMAGAYCAGTGLGVQNAVIIDTEFDLGD